MFKVLEGEVVKDLGFLGEENKGKSGITRSFLESHKNSPNYICLK